MIVPQQPQNSLPSFATNLGGRYSLTTALGQGGMGRTYGGQVMATGQPVAIKIVSLHQSRDWKVIELFEREAKILAQLDHPAIPKYLDYFEWEEGGDLLFCLVQEWVRGVSLRQWVNKRGPMLEADMVAIAQRILPILSYLHGLNPPVIHRDIKPDNLILQPKGDLYLVDFGAVQDVYRNSVSYASTFVGTLGYMPLEQLRGHSRPTSDLYSLGMTLQFLLTGKDPAPLVLDRPLRSQRLPLSPERQAWLMRLIAPSPEDRWPSGAIAAQHLSPDSPLSPSPSTPPLLTFKFNWNFSGQILSLLIYVLATMMIIYRENAPDSRTLQHLFLLLSALISAICLPFFYHWNTLNLEKDHFIVYDHYVFFTRKHRGRIEDIFNLEYRLKKIKSKGGPSRLEHYVVLWEGVKPYWLRCESEAVAQEIIAQIEPILEEKRNG
ncbi:serine/threonine-protein kinase [Spirulina sp. CCNP1310]|uniref:serine/threonine protein kinase n=1 Tax=Spirulina sp. CCNP1310 TaxID=3110249 RepID=UPI002B1ED81A|nr:serine/threonine-protein kinase [Spirulina sp. CCNP1310]MEA5418485.1 serine/threonine-protein kinase [Spirulina sp. CCNP1310]